jgi:hypothetical protein|tara:strand:+ start:11132 stop:12151 length:1020 start_codon:yes stop_codon:yes gene_type:complete
MTEMDEDEEDAAQTLQKMMPFISDHTCTETCCIDNPSAVIVKRNGYNKVLWEWNKPMVGDTFVQRVNNIYVCKSSRKVHLCTSACPHKIMNDEHCLICPISGMQWNNDTERTRSWKNTAKCLPTITTIKSDPNKFCRDINGSVISGSQNLTMQACKLEVDNLLKLMLFSQIRKQSEFSKYIDGRNTGHKRINKYAKHCQLLGKPVNISTMCTLYVNTVFKQPNFFRTQQTIDTSSIYTQYTNILIAYWKVLLINHSFKLFIPSCLYLMRSGVCVDGIYVIDQCVHLENILPEASTLDLYGIHKAQFTHTKNLILKEIRQHVPQVLCDKIKSVCRDMAMN